MSESQVVGLDCLLEIDPSLVEIADLPIGWEARRNSVGGQWERSQRGGDGGN